MAWRKGPAVRQPSPASALRWGRARMLGLLAVSVMGAGVGLSLLAVEGTREWPRGLWAILAGWALIAAGVAGFFVTAWITPKEP